MPDRGISHPPQRLMPRFQRLEQREIPFANLRSAVVGDAHVTVAFALSFETGLMRRSAFSLSLPVRRWGLTEAPEAACLARLAARAKHTAGLGGATPPPPPVA